VQTDEQSRSESEGAIDDDVATQAATWVARRADGDRWTASDEAALRDWLDRSPRHQLEYERAEAALRMLGDANVFPEGEVERVLAEARGTRTRSAWRGGAVAAAVALVMAGVIGAAVTWYPASRPADAAWAAQHRTGIGERQRVELIDGSRVDLDAGTVLRCAFTDSARDIELTAGRALFDVEHDATRPFTVVIPDGRAVRVTGTTFSVTVRPVDDDHDGPVCLEVVVAEGSVMLVDAATPAAVDVSAEPSIRLTTGQRLDWRPDADAPTIKPFDPAEFAAWRDGRLVYRDEPLAHIVVDLNRYFRGEIRLADPSLGELTVPGTFRVDNLSAVFRALEQTLPVEVRQPLPEVVTIAPVSDRR